MVMLFDIFHMPENVFSVVFATEQQITVAKLLLCELKVHKGELTKQEMSIFANSLHAGMETDVEICVGPIKKIEKTKISYNKRQFYDRILTPMKTMGMIDYDMVRKKYIISSKFVDELSKIGMMWRKEVTLNLNQA
ncbi:hypothetical protein JXB27_01845 [Candidatus Woesearchaeota archaeon]|nr:hypothetical protein [Candidatus Woesearchaeota archaeon]